MYKFSAIYSMINLIDGSEPLTFEAHGFVGRSSVIWSFPDCSTRICPGHFCAKKHTSGEVSTPNFFCALRKGKAGGALGGFPSAF